MIDTINDTKELVDDEKLLEAVKAIKMRKQFTYMVLEHLLWWLWIFNINCLE